MSEPSSLRILIVKLTAIGDIVHAMPVACALRERFPNAFIGWLAEGRAADVLRGHRAIDELIVAPRRWSRSLRSIWALRRTLKLFQFEITLDLQGLTKSALAARLSGARRRIGFAGEMGREISTWLNNERRLVRSAHVVDRYLELLGALGSQKPAVKFDVPQASTEVASVDRMLAELDLPGDFAVINPGAGWPSKRWPSVRFATVARHLAMWHDLPSIVAWGGTEEHAWAKTIAAESNGAAAVAPNTSLLELAELARRARLFIAADTGPLHIAAAVGTPCVGLFGPMPAERNGPYGPPHIAIQKARLEGGSRTRRRTDNGTMLAITIDDVCTACDEQLSRRHTRAA